MNLESINKFLKRVQESQKNRSLEFRMTMSEALELSTSISLLLSKNNSLLEEINQLQKEKIEESKNTNIFNTTIGMDGGKF